ncbi:MAG: DUF6364 family protein [Cyclobacteriaceae bacterium]|nr:DUF6364 family protein [Cyclobacteriaceae bacterium]
MKKITLSIPEDVLRRSREYAKKQGITLNQMVRNFLRQTIADQNENMEDRLDKIMDEMGVDTKNLDYNREDLYER